MDIKPTQPPDKHQRLIQALDKYYGQRHHTVEDSENGGLAAIEAIIARTAKESFRAGQLDCRSDGDPRNHAHFDEAVARTNRESRIDGTQRTTNALKTAFLDAEYAPFGGELKLIDQVQEQLLAVLQGDNQS